MGRRGVKIVVKQEIKIEKHKSDEQAHKNSSSFVMMLLIGPSLHTAEVR